MGYRVSVCGVLGSEVCVELWVGGDGAEGVRGTPSVAGQTVCRSQTGA